MNVKANSFFKYALCALLIIPLLGCVENRLAAIDAQTGEPIANAMVLSSKNPKLFPVVDSNFIGLTDTNGQMRDFSMFSENFYRGVRGILPGPSMRRIRQPIPKKIESQKGRYFCNN